MKRNGSKARKHFEKGTVLFKKGNLVDASFEFEKALELDPNEAEHLFWVAKMMVEFGDARTLDMFDAAIKLEPENPQYHFEKGDYLATKWSYDEALVEMGIAIELSPQNPDYHYFRGMVYIAMRRFPDALKEYQECLKLEPGNAEYALAKEELLLQIDHNNETQVQKITSTIANDYKRHPLRYQGYLEISRQIYFL